MKLHLVLDRRAQEELPDLGSLVKRVLRAGVFTVVSMATASTVNAPVQPPLDTHAYVRKPIVQGNPFRDGDKKAGPNFKNIKLYARVHAKAFGISDVQALEDTAYALIFPESGGNQSAVSKEGAVGIMQIHGGLDEQAWSLVKKDPNANMYEGVRRLASAMQKSMKYLGTNRITPATIDYSLAQYNMGEGGFKRWVERKDASIAKYDAVLQILPTETRQYIRKVNEELRRPSPSTYGYTGAKSGSGQYQQPQYRPRRNATARERVR